jgi:hypothetical protein
MVKVVGQTTVEFKRKRPNKEEEVGMARSSSSSCYPSNEDPSSHTTIVCASRLTIIDADVHNVFVHGTNGYKLYSFFLFCDLSVLVLS